jgi:hypothetical protein
MPRHPAFAAPAALPRALPATTATSPVPLRASAVPAVTRLRSAAAVSASLAALASSDPARVRVVVLGFTAAGCRACAYAGHAYAKVARGRRRGRDGEGGGVFYEVDVKDAGVRDVCRELGVESVPSWRVFASCESGAVYEVDEVVGPRAVGRVAEVVDRLVEGGFDIGDFE